MKSTTQRVFCRILALFSLMLSSLATAQVFDTEETVSYYHVNLQGAPIASTDESAAIKWTQSYSAFGYHEPNSDRLMEPNSVRFGLAGHVEDQYEGRLLVYMQGRYYDPQIGRFLSMDPVGFMESNPQSFNRYAYGNNNPTRFIDPDGQVPVETLWDIANIGIGVVSLGTNLISGNFAGAAVDLGGIVLDTASAIVPYVPGGAGVANKTRRAAEAAAGVPNSTIGAMQVLSFGKNSAAHFRSHSQHIRETARRLGIEIPKGPGKPETRSAMEEFLTSVVTNGTSATGRFKNVENAQFSKLGDAVVVRRGNGEWLSFLDATKGGQAKNLPSGL